MKRLVITKRGWFFIVWLTLVGMMAFAATSDEQTQNMKSQAEDQAQQHQDAMMDNTDTMKEHSGHMKEHMDKMTQQCHISGRSDKLQSAYEILGQDIRNSSGQVVGQIKELILNDSRQSVDYVVISANDKLYPVPWRALETSRDNYTLNISTDSLKQAPTINSLDSSQFKDLALRDKSNAFYKEQIGASHRINMGQRTTDWAQKQAVQLSSEKPTDMIYTTDQIFGDKVQDRQGDDIGELKDIVFDVREGNLAYGLVSFGGVMGIASKTAAVPWEAIQLESTGEIAKLDADKSSLDKAVLRDNDLSRLSEPAFARQLHEDFHQEPYWEVFGFVAPTGAQDMSMTAWQAGSDYNQHFKPDTVETVGGTIKQVSSFTPAEGAAEGLSLTIQASDGSTVTVYAGPHDNYMQQSLRFNEGDLVTITGSRTTVDTNSVIIASRIQKSGSIFLLRDSQGNPLWKTGYMQPMKQQIESESEMRQDTQSQ